MGCGMQVTGEAEQTEQLQLLHLWRNWWREGCRRHLCSIFPCWSSSPLKSSPCAFNSRSLGGDVASDGDFLIFEGNRYSRKGFLFKSFAMAAVVRIGPWEMGVAATLRGAELGRIYRGETEAKPVAGLNGFPLACPE